MENREKIRMLDIITAIFICVGIILIAVAIADFMLSQFQKQKVYYVECSANEQECNILNLEAGKKIFFKWHK